MLYFLEQLVSIVVSVIAGIISITYTSGLMEMTKLISTNENPEVAASGFSYALCFTFFHD